MYTIYSLVAGIILTLSLSPSVIVCSLRAFHIELVSLCHFLKSVVVGIGYSQDPASSVLHTGDQVPLLSNGGYPVVSWWGFTAGLGRHQILGWFCGAASVAVAGIGSICVGGFSCHRWHLQTHPGLRRPTESGNPGPSLPYPSNLCLPPVAEVAPSWSLSC